MRDGRARSPVESAKDGVASGLSSRSLIGGCPSSRQAANLPTGWLQFRARSLEMRAFGTGGASRRCSTVTPPHARGTAGQGPRATGGTPGSASRRSRDGSYFRAGQVHELVGCGRGQARSRPSKASAVSARITRPGRSMYAYATMGSRAANMTEWYHDTIRRWQRSVRGGPCCTPTTGCSSRRMRRT